MQRGSALLGVGHASQHMHWLRRSLVTGPLHLAIKDHPPVKLFPFRALRSLSSSRLLRYQPVDWPYDFLWVSGPFNGIPRRSPLLKRAVPCAPRFRSRVFATPQRFQATPSFAALFRAATVPGILPSEPSPRKDRPPLSRRLAPLQLSTGAR